MEAKDPCDLDSLFRNCLFSANSYSSISAIYLHQLASARDRTRTAVAAINSHVESTGKLLHQLASRGSTRSYTRSIIFAGNSFRKQGSIIGQDASISWQMPRFDVQSLVDGSERLKSYETKIDGDTITIGARPPLTQPVGLSTRYQTVFNCRSPGHSGLPRIVLQKSFCGRCQKF
jgi:hypothetical protein